MIFHTQRAGFRIEAADKWPGSIEDGITIMRPFRRIAQPTEPDVFELGEEAGKLVPGLGWGQRNLLRVAPILSGSKRCVNATSEDRDWPAVGVVTRVSDELIVES